jgi:hypothetical protein
MEEAEREREYWDTFSVFAHEIKKNENLIREWQQSIGTQPVLSLGGIPVSSDAYFANLIKDAEMRNAHLMQRILELEREQNSEDEIDTL